MVVVLTSYALDRLHLRETALSGLKQYSNRRRPFPPTCPALAGGQRLGRSSVSTTGSDTGALFSGVESAAVVRELASSSLFRFKESIFSKILHKFKSSFAINLIPKISS